MHKGAPSSSFGKAKQLRSNMTKAEVMLWSRLKNNGCTGLKFRRQHPLHLFIVDFYCHKIALVIEIDGEYHNSEEQKALDKERTELLNFQDIHVIRFTNNEVYDNLNKVIESIEVKVDALLQL
ncbi:endonuclease domain-containing protein [Bizionia myxarmorum]|uniref:Endonuclease domain-containing protein n=2 Tax=Bizionia myxarmorum TaxID=291186 RepID=A0A5D0REH2_9FLAO|nr:endonuclease domain-containing protein [Bizionia myxarmorum]